MIVLVGANSWLASKIGPILSQHDELMLIGRRLPEWAQRQDSGLASRISFTYTSYSAGDGDFPRVLDVDSKLTIVFIGIGVTPGLLAHLEIPEIRDCLDSHLAFPMSLIQAALPTMIVAKFGRVIFIGSSQGSKGIIGATLYTTIKAAQKGLSRSISSEYGRFGITSNVIDVGYLGAGGQADFLTAATKNLFSRSTPSGKFVDPKDVASTILHLIGNSSISGQVVRVDAGA